MGLLEKRISKIEREKQNVADKVQSEAVTLDKAQQDTANAIIKEISSENFNTISQNGIDGSVEELKNQAETTKQKIQNEINLLENKTDDASVKQKEEAETLLNSFNEILSLYTTIIASVDGKNGEKEQKQLQQKENSDGEKNGFTKAKEWV